LCEGLGIACRQQAILVSIGIQPKKQGAHRRHVLRALRQALEQQHPVAPIREPSERLFQKEMSQFLRTVAKEGELSLAELRFAR
jgi:hypothetical protein